MDEESGGSPARDDISGIAGSYKSTVAPLTPTSPSRVARDDFSGLGGSFKSTVAPLTPIIPSRVAPKVPSSIVIGGFDNPAMTFDTDFPKEFTSVPMARESKM